MLMCPFRNGLCRVKVSPQFPSGSSGIIPTHMLAKTSPWPLLTSRGAGNFPPTECQEGGEMELTEGVVVQ